MHNIHILLKGAFIVILGLSMIIITQPSRVKAERRGMPKALEGYKIRRGLTKTMQRYKARRLDLMRKKVNGPRYAPAMITVNASIPILLGYYNNGSPDWPPDDLKRELFDGPWDTGTLRDYFQEVSYGQLSVDGEIHGWYELSHTRTYYEGSEGDNGFFGPPGGIADFIDQLLTLADSDVDFSGFDNDGPDGSPNSGDDDGYVDMISFVHEGIGGECGGCLYELFPQDTNQLWSHEYAYREWWGNAFVTDDPSANGGYIKVDEYALVPAESCNCEDMIEIGVFAHELGHVLGLPDLYDTDESSEGIGIWGLMSSGAYGGDMMHDNTPVHPCAWSKYYVGWVIPTEVSSNLLNFQLLNVEEFAEIIKVSIPNSDEYFLVENRQKIGFDRYLPGEGVLIWHVDPSVITDRYDSNTVNDDENHKGVDLEEADGLEQLDKMINPGDAGDTFPGSKGNRSFDNYSTPSSRSYAGELSNIAIKNIPDPASTMTLDVIVEADQGDLDPPKVTSTSPSNNDSNVKPETSITITFDEEMAHETVEGAFSIEPKIAGEYSWKDDTLIFTPSVSLTEGTNYIVKISSQASDLAGNMLDGDNNGRAGGDYTFNFTTKSADLEPPTFPITSEEEGDQITAPCIEEFIPDDGRKGVRVSSMVQIVFSQPMDPENAREAFEISPFINGIISVEGSRLTFIPDEDLEYAAVYTITVSEEATDTNGIGLDGDNDGNEGGIFSFSFTTESPPEETGDSEKPRKKRDKRCFIATAVYGTTRAREVEVLRNFRDTHLLTSRMGSEIVNLYYRISPPIADFIAVHPLLRRTVKEMLKPFIWCIKRLQTPAEQRK